MPESSEQTGAERAMLRALLSVKRWNREALRVRLEYLDRQAYDAAFASLVVSGVAVADRVDVQASRQLAHLAALGVLDLDPAPRNGAPDAETMDRILARQPPRW
jgi:hypothetical protein